MPAHMPALFTRHAFHKPNKRRKRGTLVSPHSIIENFTVGQPPLRSTLFLLRAGQLPHETWRHLADMGATPQPTLDASSRSFWALSSPLSAFRAASPLPYVQTRTIILWTPLCHSPSHSFQFTQGEPTHGLADFYSIDTF